MAERESITLGEIVRLNQPLMIPAVLGVAGATGGFVSGTNVGIVTCPASQTGATFKIPVVGLRPGYTIRGFYLSGQIESGGNTATLDADLRKVTAATAGSSDASVGAITQISRTADVKISATNSTKSGLSEVVAADETFYVLVTVTTGAATDIELNHLVVLVDEV